MENDLGRVADEYFKTLYALEDGGFQVDELKEIPQRLSAEQNEELPKEVSVEEVKKATFNINPNKCPVPNGMNGHFYQQFWESLGAELTEMVRSFFESGVRDDGMNKTNICLIPKK